MAASVWTFPVNTCRKPTFLYVICSLIFEVLWSLIYLNLNRIFSFSSLSFKRARLNRWQVLLLFIVFKNYFKNFFKRFPKSSFLPIKLVFHKWKNLYKTLIWPFLVLTVTYSGPCQICMMVLFCENSQRLSVILYIEKLDLIFSR